MTATKHGVSALGLQRLLGLGSYETAWSVLHKLRRAMLRPGRDRLSGEVEVDETAIGAPPARKAGARHLRRQSDRRDRGRVEAARRLRPSATCPHPRLLRADAGRLRQ